MTEIPEVKICVVGLGYVGLPLAIKFAEVFPTIGYDTSQSKIDNLKIHTDPSGEVSNEDLKNSKITYTTNPKCISQSNFIIVAVPTPINSEFKPDLSFIEKSTETIGKHLSKDTTIVYESTVYPGVTEDICIPILEKYSNLKAGKEFKVGYSPERINPGDKIHTVENVIKIAAGQDQDSTDFIANVYSKIIKAGIYKAQNIKTAEAAKVIENIQRDLNIALVNELALIFDKLGINTRNVIEAAGTKWNFHKYYPGLVGGHCISTDPYYLTHRAQQLNFSPRVILAGRSTNEYMSRHVSNLVIYGLNEAAKVLKHSTVLLLGLTFKENVPDPRNSKAKDLINHLKTYGITILGIDPWIDAETIRRQFNIDPTTIDDIKMVDSVILINSHNQFKSITLDILKSKMDKPILIDVKSFYNEEEAKSKGFIYKSL